MSIQALLEKIALGLIDTRLGDTLKETGKLFYASDAGTAISAASYSANELGDSVEKMQHVYLGPKYTNKACIQACLDHENKPDYEVLENTTEYTAKLLAEGTPVSWFQGRMEFGPLALGNRSIIGNPGSKGVAEDMLQTDHPSPYMTFTFDVAESWKERIAEVVHEDGTARAQIVTAEINPRYYELLTEVEKLTGNGVVLNTSLNRRGDPMVCSPTDALTMFYGSDLEYLVMEDILVRKIKPE
ncbi:MAG: carbamoyltransferase C-terminal domain-containing protein [Cycloclasticus sp.]